MSNKILYESFWDNLRKANKHVQNYDQDSEVKHTNITPFARETINGKLKIGHNNNDTGESMVNSKLSKQADKLYQVHKHNQNYDQDSDVKSTNITPFIRRTTSGKLKFGHDNNDTGESMVNTKVSNILGKVTPRKPPEKVPNAWTDKSVSPSSKIKSDGSELKSGKPEGQPTGFMDKVKEHAGAVKQWAQDNPGKAAAIGAATAAGLGALAFRKKIAEKFRKNK